MNKVFISQMMGGLTFQEIFQERQRLISKVKELLKEDIEVINTLYNDINCDSPLKYLGRAISDLSQADYAYFPEGWEQARGCVIEHLCCELYGIKIIEVQN